MAWFFSFILTVAGAFPTDADVYGYGARTDLRTDVLRQSAWFRFPYPGKRMESLSFVGPGIRYHIILVRYNKTDENVLHVATEEHKHRTRTVVTEEDYYQVYSVLIPCLRCYYTDTMTAIQS